VPVIRKGSLPAHDRQTDTHGMACFPGQPEYAGSRKTKPFWILMKQEMMGWQWHQLNHMQIICTALQTDNHVNTSVSLQGCCYFFTGQTLFLMPNQQC